ncbi:hypothetical protein QUB75_18120 [Microcoleus sp. K1-B6]|uniref:hypothetical protein n=1 Tax=unclassified Microcoleus TaxID=2642155 RepID=UPI002FD14E44
MLHYSQLVFYEQAFRPVPQENLYFVEQASCLLLTMVQDIRLRKKQADRAVMPRSAKVFCGLRSLAAL